MPQLCSDNSEIKTKRRHSKSNIPALVALFEPPNEILSDNGGEFNNELLKEVSDHLNILNRSTTGESP